MSLENTPPTPPAPSAQQPMGYEQEEEISLLDLALVLAKHKRLILGFPLVVGLLTAVAVFLMKPIYTATARILPPQPNPFSVSAALLAQVSSTVGANVASLAGLKNPNDLYVGMLKSDTVVDALIRRFNLMERYEKEYLVDTRKKLREDVSKITAGKDGIITIEVDDPDPRVAAEIANAFVEELQKLMGTLAVTDAARRRLFFEQQLKEAKENLAQAELTAKAALDKGGVARVDAQGLTLIETTSQIRAQIALKEVELNAMKAFAAENNPQLFKIRQELTALRQQLAKLEGGAAEKPAREGGSNDMGLESVALLREVKFREAVVEQLTKLYESARIDEANDAVLIQVLDKAQPPDRKSKPKRALIVLLSTLAAGVLATIWAFIREALDKARQDPKEAERLALLREYLRFH